MDRLPRRTLKFTVLLPALALPGLVRKVDGMRRGVSPGDCLVSGGNNFSLRTQEGVEIRGSSFGKGPNALFFSHGWTCNRSIFNLQASHFKDRYLIVTYDQRGHGESGVPENLDYSTERLADDLNCVVERFNPDRFVVVGHSLGGFAAFKFYQKYAGRYGNRLKGLVIVDSTGTDLVEAIVFGRVISLLYPDPLGRMLEFVGRRSSMADRFRIALKNSTAAYMAVRLAAFGKRPAGEQVEFMTDMVMSTPVVTMALGAKSCLDFRFEDFLGEVKPPALMLVGEKDRLTSLDANERTASMMPKARLVVFPGAGHCTLMERHELFNTELERFFDRVFGG